MKPLFKWAGGKTKELSKIRQFMPNNINTFYEPFVGGGAVWFNLNNTPSVVNDKWDEIYNFYHTLKNNHNILVPKLNSIIDEYNNYYFNGITKEQFKNTSGKLYYYYRDNIFTDNIDKAIRFWILRQLSFSGMNRFNSNGKYNVPFGWYKSLKKFEWDSNYENLLNNTIILNTDFEECLKDVEIDDFVFLDPPYTTKFNKYSPDGLFDKYDHIRLNNWFKNSKSNNMIIINKDEFTLSLYKDYIVDEYEYKYSIKVRDRISKSDSTITHLLAVNYKVNSFY
jgi:DNA adenine methylase